MHILFVQSGVGAGGAEKTLAQLASHRATMGDTVTMLTMESAPECPYFPIDGKVQCRVLGPVPPHLPMQLARMRFIRNEVRRCRPDIVVSFLTKINVLTLLALSTARVPIIVSERNNPNLQRNHFLWRWMNAATGGLATRIVVLTDAALADMPDHLRGRTRVIPNPCAPLAEHRFDRTAGKKIVAVGRLTEQKGFDLLIRAFGAVVKAHPDARLSIFGEGRDRSALQEQIAALGLTDSVTLEGLSRQPGAWVRDADIFVLSSRHEGLCNALQEAVVTGIPAVAFDCDYGPRELIQSGSNGLLVPTGNVGALSEAMIDLLSNPEMRQRFAAAAPLARARFEPKRILEQWEEVIQSAVSERSA